jgi:hypothetical protein
MTKLDVLNAIWAMMLEAWPVGGSPTREGIPAYFALERLWKATNDAHMY